LKEFVETTDITTQKLIPKEDVWQVKTYNQPSKNIQTKIHTAELINTLKPAASTIHKRKQSDIMV
jgi:hypothetical protein